MPQMRFGEAIDHALAVAMAADERVLFWGEDVHLIHAPLYGRFGPERVRPTPISEGAFLGAGVGAALGGLRPVVEIMMVDFLFVAFDALLNHAPKIETFTGGQWTCPLVVRTPCGAGYGDGGTHSQALWGLIGAIPGLAVVVPSNPADGAGAMAAALEHPGPVVLLEHKLLSDIWLEGLGRGGRESLDFDVPAAGRLGEVPDDPSPLPIGHAAVVRPGEHVTICTLGVGVHRSLAAASQLARDGISAEVIDLRWVRPLDRDTVAESVSRTGALVVVDEDYRDMGLSGELAASMLERGLQPAYARVAVETTIPYPRDRERQTLPNVERIVAAVRGLR